MKRFAVLISLALVLSASLLICYAQPREVSTPGDPIALAWDFVKSLETEDFSKAVSNFDSQMKAAMPPNKLEEAWKAITAQAGAFKRQVGVRTEETAGFNIVYVKCDFEKGAIDVKVVFNSTRQISGLWFVPTQSSAEYKPPAFAKPDIFKEKEVLTTYDDLTVLAQDFVILLSTEDFSNAVSNFDSQMTAAMPPNKLEEAWKAITAQAGLFKRQVGVRTEEIEGFNIVYVKCDFEKGTMDAKVVFNSARQISGLWFVPSQASVEYKLPGRGKPNVFQEKEVVVGTGDWVLPGTLTLPKGNGPFPAVVLVHGSGPHDRDETIGPNKPFRDLAWGLAARNVAVLRYEKRTKALAIKTALINESITVKEETIDDALAAVELLRKTPEVNSKKIFVLGHSLGGMLMPRVATLDPAIAGFIIMAAASRPLEDVYLEQLTYIYALDGQISASEEAQLEQVKGQVNRVKDPNLSVTTPASDLPLGLPARYWLDLRGYKPAEAAKKLLQPMLILHGLRDYQVTIEDLEGWKTALSSRNNVEFKTYPNLNHLFMPGEGKSTPAEYQLPRNIPAIVFDDIANWIKKQ